MIRFCRFTAATVQISHILSADRDNGSAYHVGCVSVCV